MKILKYINRNIKDKDLKKDNIFIGEGLYVVERMIHAHCEILFILCIPANKEYFTDLVKNTCPVIEKTKEELATFMGFKFHRGVLACARRPKIPDLSTFLLTTPANSPLIVLPSLCEAENMGSIIRCAVAFSFQGIVMGPGCIDPFSRKAIRCSMGTLFEIPLVSFTHDRDSMTTLHEHEFFIIGTTPSLAERQKQLESFRFPPGSAIVFGHESEGLPPPWDTECDSYLRIKISPHLDSLNVGVAAGIFLYEFSKQNQR